MPRGIERCQIKFYLYSRDRFPYYKRLDYPQTCQAPMTNTNDWLKATRALLAARPAHMTLPKIAAETGLSLPWLLKFSRDATGNPGVVYVNTLHAYLSNATAEQGN